MHLVQANKHIGHGQGDLVEREHRSRVLTQVTIILVNYNTCLFLRQCLSALHQFVDLDRNEIVVVDHASQDYSADMVSQEFPSVTLISNSRNVGFATANNQAMRITEGEYVLVLNPDTIVPPDLVSGLVQFMYHHPRTGAVGPRLVSIDGTLQTSCRRFPTSLPILLRTTRLHHLFPGPMNHYLMMDWDHAAVREVDWLFGACLMLRRHAVEQIGFFDERFFLYYEDVDLCYRLWQAGWKVYYCPQITLPHYHQRASARGLNRFSIIHFVSICRLFRKYPHLLLHSRREWAWKSGYAMAR